MSPFPTQDSTLSAEALAEHVLPRYRLGKTPTCRFFRKGICDTYQVEATGRHYYLKVYRSERRTHQDVAEEIRLLAHLGRHGVSVARPIKRRDGRCINRLRGPEESRHAVLFEGARGVDYDESEAQTGALGGAVARVHECADRMRRPYARQHLDMAYLVDRSLRTIKPQIAHRPRDFALIQQIAGHCSGRVLELLPTTQPEYGVCHGDIHGGDVRYAEDHTPTLFDFESSGCGWRALEIGVFLASFEWMDISPEGGAHRQRQLGIFLKGYSAVRPLSENELAAIQLGPPIRHIHLMAHVLEYTSLYEGWHWAGDPFIDWHMTWFNHWHATHLA